MSTSKLITLDDFTTPKYKKKSSHNSTIKLNKINKKIRANNVKKFINYQKQKRKLHKEKEKDIKLKVQNGGKNKDDFEDSLSFLKSLEHNKTQKNKSSTPDINIELPSELKPLYMTKENIIADETDSNFTLEPPYGNLKNGTKPTCRDWKRRTQKKTPPINTDSFDNTKTKIQFNSDNFVKHFDKHEPVIVPTTADPISDSVPSVLHEPVTVNKLPAPPSLPTPNKVEPVGLPTSHPIINHPKTNTLMTNDVYENMMSLKPEKNKKGGSKRLKQKSPKKYKLNRKTKTVKHKLGKNTNKKTISVLIKNNKTRKAIKKELKEHKTKDISEVKRYLKDKNLIKSGTNAPDNVIRAIYEQSVLCGDINNITKGNLLHNYLS